MITPKYHFINQFIICFQVSPILGAIIEGIATCLCRLASRAIAEVGPKYAAAMDSFIGTSLVLAGKSQEIYITTVEVKHFCHFINSTFSWLIVVLIIVLFSAIFKIKPLKKYFKIDLHSVKHLKGHVKMLKVTMILCLNHLWSVLFYLLSYTEIGEVVQSGPSILLI